MDARQKILLSAAILLIAFASALIWHTASLGRARVVFCDVGQGDGMLIITPSGKKIVVDGGPGNKILGCLAGKIPFWDKQIDMVISTHPQQDHMEGLVAVLANYDVKNIVATGFKNSTGVFGAWQRGLAAEHAKIIKPVWGQKYVFDQSGLAILWPTAEAYNEWEITAPGEIDLNQTSIVSRYEEGSFCIWLTGDTPKEIIDKVIDKNCPVIKVSHHGSRTGTDEEEIVKINPKIAVIQVGAKNRFGHPHKEVLDILALHGVQILRNDELGTFEIKSDGKNLEVVKN